MKKISIALILLLASSAFGSVKWEAKTFTDDTAQGIEELNAYCETHGVKTEDVLWANHTTEQEIASGTTIYLPANHAELLAIWQHVGAWKPTALVPVTSGAAARRLVEPEVKPQRTAVSLSSLPNIETPKLPSVETPKLPSIETPKVPSVETPKIPSVEIPNASTIRASAVSEPAPVAKTQSTPAKVIAQTAKPDKILTAKKKLTKPEIPGLMDPIIILSPNGDANTGPMRLIISGDKVEVVKLPQDAAPKTPTPSDADAPFTSGYSYVSFYSPGVTATPKTFTNNTMTNINTLSGKMMWPVDGKISSPFGKWRGKHKHEGIDIPMPAGTPIRAAKNGVVERTGNNSTMGFRGYGNFVMLDHGGNVKTFYAHCSSVAVVQGQRIMQGQIIAYVGSTGRSTANHLHFEVRINNAKVNPVPYLAGNSHVASHK